MRLTTQRLKKLIREELKKMNESTASRIASKVTKSVTGEDIMGEPLIAALVFLVIGGAVGDIAYKELVRNPQKKEELAQKLEKMPQESIKVVLTDYMDIDTADQYSYQISQMNAGEIKSYLEDPEFSVLTADYFGGDIEIDPTTMYKESLRRRRVNRRRS